MNNEEKGKRKKGPIIAGTVLGVIIIALFVFFYRGYRAGHISTDDAFVEGYIHTIAAKVPGTVKTIHVKDNQQVQTGDLLAEIDAADYEVKVREASWAADAEKRKLQESEHRLDTARKQLAEIFAEIGAAKANAQAEEANLRQAGLDMKRAENLVKTEAISRERYDRTRTAQEVAEARLKAAREQVVRVEASLEAQRAVIRQHETALGTFRATIENKQAILDGAHLSRSYTRIYAPVSGYITKRSVETGNQINAGQPLMAVVPLGDVWVIANYKETQLTRVRPGQKVRISVDTYPGRTFNGVVDSIMAGTGASFSLFPPENATGNYVKVVQRIPVKILVERGSDKAHELRVGMSVEPTIIIE
jgi:membrane fusion protein, multidrug efflux system